MQMTEKDICKEYRESKNPNEQIKILAELNATTYEHIVEILKANDEPLRKRLYTRKKAEPVKVFSKPAKKKAPAKKAKPAAKIPDSIKFIIVDRIDALDNKYSALEEKLDDLQNEIKQNRKEKQELMEFLKTQEG